MPQCSCESYKCLNRSLSQRVYNEHKLADQLLWRTRAYEEHQEAISRQHDALVSEVAALTIAGNSNLYEEPALAPDPPASRRSTSKSQKSANDPHKLLDQVTEEVATIAAYVSLHLPNVGRPSAPKQRFPMRDAILDLRALESRLARILSSSSTFRQRKEACRRRLHDTLESLSEASSLWGSRSARSDPPKESSNVYDSKHHFDSILNGVDRIIQVSLFTMVALQIVLHLPRRGCRFLLNMIRYIVQLSFHQDLKSISAKKTDFVENFPIDPDSATSKFPLNGKETILAVCPNAKCHKNYAPTFSKSSTIPIYPKYCSHQEFEFSPVCGTALTRRRMYGNIEIQVPIKVFVSFSFKDFLASLLSRVGLEDLMDNPKQSETDTMKDVNDGEFLRNFTHDDGTPFKSTLKVGRYTFSVCIDSFNPLTQKQAGKKISIGMISVVCLSLPETHRYKFENMFLAGVIPGPNEPPLTALNHYFTPLVDDFAELWAPGVHFTKTHNHPDGRLVQGALTIIVCDLMGARKAAGFAAISQENFCSCCHCTRSVHGYGNTDYHTWKRRTNTEWREAAQQFREAATSELQQRTFDKTGVRWTEFLRLPYFDIGRCVVVDSMHNLFLGLLKEHFRGILGVEVPVERQKAVIILNLEPLPDDLSENDVKGVTRLKNLLQAPAAISFLSPDDALTKLTSNVNMKSLKHVCAKVHCAIPPDSEKPKKEVIAQLLYRWRLAQKEVRDAGPDTTRLGHVFDLDDMREIWKDLENMTTPSWLTSVPSNLGKASHGKLKADQWRTLGTVHLPLSLIRIWGNTDYASSRSVRCRKILDVTMSLVSAIIVATSRTTSPEHAEAYLQHMLDYLDGIKELFPEYKLRPNHHMSLHIHEFILLFGPIRSWWTFPFERLIGALQRMPHNDKLGELEASMARAYTRAANLRAILLKSGCPQVIRNTENIFRKLVDPQMRNTLQTDVSSLERIAAEDDGPEEMDISEDRIPRPLPHDLQQVLNDAGIHTSTTAHLPADIMINGLTFSKTTKHKGNACIILADAEPAQIQHIVQFPDNPTTTYLIIRRHKHSKRHHDPYEQYPQLRAKLWDTQLCKSEVVRSKDVRCHFASLEYDGTSIVVLPLAKHISVLS